MASIVLVLEFTFYSSLLTLSPLGKGCGPSFEQIQMPLAKRHFVSPLVDTVPEVLEKKFLKSLGCYFAISLLFILGKGMVSQLNKFDLN